MASLYHVIAEGTKSAGFNLLDIYFGTELALLADRSYIYEPGRPYQYRDVTEIVKH